MLEGKSKVERHYKTERGFKARLLALSQANIEHYWYGTDHTWCVVWWQ